MESKANYGLISQICNKHSEIEMLMEGNSYKPTTQPKKCCKSPLVMYTKYGIVFLGIIVIILMVVFGINNVASQVNQKLQNVTEPTQNVTVIEPTQNVTKLVEPTQNVTVTEPTQNVTKLVETTQNVIVTEPTQTNVTELVETTQNVTVTESVEEVTEKITPQIFFEMLQSGETTTEEIEDINISNKTIIINEGNNSVIVRN